MKRIWMMGVCIFMVCPYSVWASGYRGPFDLQQLRTIIGASVSAPQPSAVPIRDDRSDTEGSISNRPVIPQCLVMYTVNYIHPMDLKQLLSDVFTDCRFTVDVRNRRLVYWTSDRYRQDIMDLIASVDVAPEQVQITVQVIETSGEFTDALRRWLMDLSRGVSWTVDLSQLALVPTLQLDGFLSALQQSGKATLVSKPTITANDNQRASIRVGDQVPYLTTVINDRSTSVQVNQVNTGVELEVLPQVFPNQVVHLEVKAVIDNIKQYRELGGGQYPVVTRRLAQTTIDIPDGETLVIAGLLDDQKKTLNTSIPGVSSLPIVGELFSGRSFESVTTDVVVLISPKVIKVKKKEALR